MDLTGEPTKRVAAFTLYAWDHAYPVTRLVAPWQQAGVELLRGTHWDQVFLEHIASSELVVVHRDFPRLAWAYQQVMQQARSLGKPVFFDLDDLLFELPAEHPDRQYHFVSDALFPILQAVVEADAVTVSTPALREAILPLNPNTLLLPTCLDERLWSNRKAVPGEKNQPLVIGWVNDRQLVDGIDDFANGMERFLLAREDTALLRVWGRRPPEALLALSNVDWLPNLPTSYLDFAARVSRERIDIAVIPHGSGQYDGCQSPLRYLELSVCGIAGIYSHVSPYQDIISDQQDGWLASSAEKWLHALEALAGSPDLRYQTAASAQKILQQGWLLSQNAHLWKEALDNSILFAAEHKKIQAVANQVAQISDQVRRWQRLLEQRLYEREWEVRAVNLQAARKDRQAGEYIQQLGSQLEEIWSDPAWRLLHKAKRLAQMASSPGDFVKSKGQPATSQGAGTAPQEGKGPAGESRGLFGSLQAEPVAKTFDLFYFASRRWDHLPAEIRHRAELFVEDGARVFIVSSPETFGVLPALQQTAGGIFDLMLPAENTGSESSRTTGDDQNGIQQEWFAEFRQGLGISESVCWIEDPAWAKLAYRLRNQLGWKIVSTRQAQQPGEPGTALYLQNRNDLLLDSRFEELPYDSLRQTLHSLYPKASIVILTYNNLNYTRQCLESIFAKTAYPSYEVVIVDNASTDGTVEFLQAYAAQHLNVQLVLNGENRGFAAGNNQGVAASSGEYIVFLNNDTVVTPGWLSGLVSHLRDPAIGAVGPVTNYAGNESKIGVDYSDISGLDDFARRRTLGNDGEEFEIRMLALFCMLVRRSVIEEVGLLDERFGVGMYEDDDFSLRIRQKGYRIVCAEDVYVHHWGSASFSLLDAERYQRLHQENRRKFEQKWGIEWQPHRWRMDDA